ASRLALVRVLTIVGNRPQFIKAAPLSLALSEAGIEERSIHTGQHWDRSMSAVFFDELGVPAPTHALDLRTADPGVIEGAVRPLVEAEKPDWVIVLGDTNSTIAATRAASAATIPVAHVEAGLRSGDLAMPEERNRIEVDRLAALLLCPDERSADTLRSEGVPGRIEIVGDVMADAARLFTPRAREHFQPPRAPGTYVLATIHREANVREPRLGRILQGLSETGEPVVFPAHPRTRRALEEHGIAVGANIELVEPLGYLELAVAASSARVIVTDSGGLQKEAYWYGVPCVTARPSTEWVDTVRLGANVLVDDDPGRLAAAVRDARLPHGLPQLYGDGYAAQRIAITMRGR
ncbi:MAG: non-hydrolyzing UDP-N-acetylglucosamine 2-epimerase, partial [Gaiella sp.]